MNYQDVLTFQGIEYAFLFVMRNPRTRKNIGHFLAVSHLELDGVSPKMECSIRVTLDASFDVSKWCKNDLKLSDGQARRFEAFFALYIAKDEQFLLNPSMRTSSRIGQLRKAKDTVSQRKEEAQRQQEELIKAQMEQRRHDEAERRANENARVAAAREEAKKKRAQATAAARIQRSKNVEEAKRTADAESEQRRLEKVAAIAEAERKKTVFSRFLFFDVILIVLG